jgi:hypothetical protein
MGSQYPTSGVLTSGNISYTIFIAMDVIAVDTNPGVWAGVINFSDQYGSNGAQINNMINMNTQIIDGWSYNDCYNSVNLASNTRYIFTHLYNNASGRTMYTNNNQTNFCSSTALNFQPYVFYVGSGYLNAVIKEILVYNFAMSTAQIAAINDYLNAKWYVY